MILDSRWFRTSALLAVAAVASGCPQPHQVSVTMKDRKSVV